MSDKILDATDVASNTDRFCDPCKEMLTRTREKSKRDLLPGRPSYRGRILAKGSDYWHPRLRYEDGPTTCELCIFLRVELGDGADTQLPLNGTFTGFALPGDPAAEFVDVLQPPFDPTSDIVFDTARGWIETCQRSHRQCQVTDRTGLSLLPTRVLDVGTSDAPTLRLHVSSSGEMAVRGEYACLSYCWGGDQFKTLLDTVEELKVHIPIDQLSLTVADAVEVTRRLALRYLWVDALCIVQDSYEDKAREIARMGAIYKNSTVTIAAATARAASEGFLRRPPPTLRAAAVRIRLPNGQIGIVRLTLSYFYEAGQARLGRDHPLDSRGWCLQEYLLSPRLLIFSMFNVERACQIDEGVAGDGPLGRGQIFRANFRLPTAIFGGETIREQLRRLRRRDVHPSFPRERVRLWQQIVNDFSCRELTDLRDRLPALAGIAGELQKAWGDEYMFGVWRRLLPWTLAWGALMPEGPAARTFIASADLVVGIRQHWSGV